MKQSYLLILFLIFVSCGNDTQKIESKLKNQIDSLSYELEKVSSELKLLKERNEEAHKTTFENEEFNSFFWNFMTDSVFQKRRIKFPLKYITWKINSNGDVDLGGKIDTIQTSESKWKYDPFYFEMANERTQIYDNFQLKFRPSNERLLHWYGVETGGDAKYYFKGFNGKWFLTAKEQLGD
ncbi:DUF4348 domain-containing protein [Labilibaculum sp. DW002]|uniref:DUF4348 domain-containing protein n=1 Tax=Paralabilibaculum antarcticum TaxID=2912572 RepID=A0ABT5VYN2_9BACT|nr:DUF4348 domain-containing protein [Labilibaculum sp. DW002]MDE5419638.1 DUF4348 domain-containing protein [Labilibaculum sp. DW002]